MNIQITKCSVSKYWYADKIGEKFPLSEKKTYEVKENNEKSNMCHIVMHENKEHVVLKDDCKEVA